MRAERVLVVAREQVLVTRSSFLCVREAAVALLRESEFLSQFLYMREAVVVHRESSYCARGVSVRAERVIIARSGPIRPNTHREQIGARLRASG